MLGTQARPLVLWPMRSPPHLACNWAEQAGICTRPKLPKEESRGNKQRFILNEPLKPITSWKTRRVNRKILRPVLVSQSPWLLLERPGANTTLNHQLSPMLLSDLEELRVDRESSILNRRAYVDTLARCAVSLPMRHRHTAAARSKKATCQNGWDVVVTCSVVCHAPIVVLSRCSDCKAEPAARLVVHAPPSQAILLWL